MVSWTEVWLSISTGERTLKSEKEIKMRTVEVTKDFENTGISFKRGHSYVMPEDVESQYRSVHGNCLGMSYPIEPIYRPYKGEDLTGKRLLTWRFGGIGDLFFLQPALRYLKKKYPTCFIRVASACKQCLENVPEIDQLYDMPFDVELMKDSVHLMYQGIIESSSEAAQKTHAVNMFFSYFGIESIHLPKEDKIPRLFFTETEKEWMHKTIRSMGIKEQDFTVAIQMESSSPLRNYPKESLKAVIDILSREENVKVVMVGNEQGAMLGQWFKGNNPNVIIATNFTVRQSMILALRYNLVVAPDSFMVQVAGALDKPLIGLYGPFPSEVRMKYFKNAVGLDPKVACSPCFKHDFRACIRGFPSPCFTQIPIETLLKAVDYMKFKFTGAHFNYMAPLLRVPNLQEAEKYMLSADKGLCFFPGYYEHPNIIRVDTDQFVKADISDLSTQFNRAAYPFVLYMREFSPKHQLTYMNSKDMVRPGGFFIVYKMDAVEQLFADIQRDVGQAGFVLMYSKFDPGTREMLIVGRKPF